MLAEVCHQFEEEGDEPTERDSEIFLSLLGSSASSSTKKRNDEPPESLDDPQILETTCELLIVNKDDFHGACIDSGAQLTVIGRSQAKAYCM